MLAMTIAKTCSMVSSTGMALDHPDECPEFPPWSDTFLLETGLSNLHTF
ncbi:MAG: hypothetical protein UW52_C0068G0014 [Candidatus Gottesmanbacteria bacterium GW2011_GWA1_44_24b]|uniref:Uncharacterized protein n=1 Tax=Candidatus Gottesmanbacteria bacterium GW2011_GWA1_44_24b TaxID=1618437 RepID=A0A0G1IEZ8_9BACT|nr:MAG: hypothetical protein UW52_C0068G0014 [Candidatus Gottesmanbacteria bacterium GW2011_GWA1_44_24b]